MEKLLIIAGAVALAAYLMMEHRRIKRHEAYDPEIERFRYMENLNPDELMIELIRMSRSDKEALLKTLINKSEYTYNNRLVIQAIRFFLIEEQTTY
ncbi:hypothetical protein [Pedobacter zeae]|uniref:Uncharacterized protein n=1 Tax=Pedobacter zeae TaxID=1737356 RepID=A0A7W6KCL5_9SPHI|nr:hypothetical protein [Pedobacter zeae]MBB4108346.1 hypothetical protein [Pedobacter zeae]GGG93399.1 hypothetical protein GCM10007422_03270 [Pedobacter zeae]